MVDSTPSAQGQGAEHHRCQVPSVLQQQGSAGPSEKVATPATECEVELLKGGRIVSNELKTKRREGERRTFTKAPGTGLVKETIPAGAQEVDVRAPRESGREDNAQIPVLLDQGQGNATEVNPAVRAAAQRTEDHSGGFGGRHQRRNASEHPRHAQRRGPSEGQPETQLGRRGHQHRAGRRKESEAARETPGMAERRVTARLSMSRLKRRGERILPSAMPESTQGEETEPPRRTWDSVPQRKLARRCQRRPVTPTSKRRTRSGLDPPGVKSLL